MPNVERRVETCQGRGDLVRGAFPVASSDPEVCMNDGDRAARPTPAGADGGRRTQVWDAVVDDGDGRTIAMFRCTQLILYPGSS